MASTAEVLVAFLATAGVRRIYGIPGAGSTLDVIEAGRHQGIEFVLAHHGAAAAIMAATEGDLAGRPGVCLAAQGPGAAGVVSGAAQALLDRAPLLILTDRSPQAGLRSPARQELSHLRLLAEAVKKGATVTAPRADWLAHWAWRTALQPPRGPVHLDLPADEAQRPARRRAIASRRMRRRSPSPSAVRWGARLLTRSGRTVVVAGSGCREAPAARALRDLLEHLGAPVLMTPRAKGAIAEDHPLAAGVFTAAPLENELLEKADAILTVGLDPAELLPGSWKSSRPVVALEEYRVGPRTRETACEVVADLPTALQALRQALPPGGGWSLASWAGRGEEFKVRCRLRLAEASAGRTHAAIPPHRAVQIAREIYPHDTLLAVDTGAHAIAANLFWEAYQPKDYLCSAGLAPLGYAIPAAIAAKLAAPERPVLAFVGDGGLLAHLAEVATAARLGLPLTILVFADESLSSIRALQEQRRFAPVGTSLGHADIPKLAEGLGALGTEVEDEEGLRAALQDALGTTQPAIIVARIRSSGYRRMLDILCGRPDAG